MMVEKYILQLYPHRTLQTNCLNIGGQDKHVSGSLREKRCNIFCQCWCECGPVQASGDLTSHPELEQAGAAVLGCLGLCGDVTWGRCFDKPVSVPQKILIALFLSQIKSNSCYLFNRNFQQAIAWECCRNAARTTLSAVRSILSEIFSEEHVALQALLASLLSSLNQATWPHQS